MGICLTPPSSGTRCCPLLPTCCTGTFPGKYSLEVHGFFKTLCPDSVQATVLPIQTRPGGMQSFAILAATVHHSAMRLLYATPMLRKLGRTGSTSPCGFMATCFRPSTERSDPLCAHFILSVVHDVNDVVHTFRNCSR